MKIGIRIISCVMLIAMALTMAVFSLADFQKEDGYRLGEHEGRVAVYSQNGSVPITVTDIALSSLRQADREMLAKGLEAATQEELLSLLEDLGS